MKKNLFKLVFVSIFASIAGYGVYNSQKKAQLSDLAIANVEALANDGESLSMYACQTYGCQFAFFMQCHVYQYGRYKGVCDGYRG